VLDEEPEDFGIELRRPGRPSKYTNVKKVLIRMESRLYERLEAIAKAQSPPIPVNTIIQRELANYVHKVDAETEKVAAERVDA